MLRSDFATSEPFQGRPTTYEKLSIYYSFGTLARMLSKQQGSNQSETWERRREALKGVRLRRTGAKLSCSCCQSRRFSSDNQQGCHRELDNEQGRLWAGRVSNRSVTYPLRSFVVVYPINCILFAVYCIHCVFRTAFRHAQKVHYVPEMTVTYLDSGILDSCHSTAFQMHARYHLHVRQVTQEG